jgi:hypothetical protein
MRVQALIAELSRTLGQLKTTGKRIAGDGAAAKACTMMNVAGIDSGLLNYLVDLNPVKQTRYTSGNHLPICHPRKLLEDQRLSAGSCAEFCRRDCQTGK